MKAGTDHLYGWAFFFLTLAIAVLPLGISLRKAGQEIDEARAKIAEVSRQRVAKTAAMAEALYLLENERAIDNLYRSYRTWLSDGQLPAMKTALEGIGFEVQVNPVEPGDETGSLQATGQKSEFARTSEVLARCEFLNGFAQFKTLRMQLPVGVKMMSLDPTFLSVQVTLETPAIPE